MMVSVKTTSDFLETEAFRRLFEASLSACLGHPGGLLRDGLRILHAILEEFSSTADGGGRPNVPPDMLYRMGSFLMQAAHWAQPNEESAEMRHQILRLLAMLPASAVLSLPNEECAKGGGPADKAVNRTSTSAGWESEELTVLQRILATEFDTESITAAEVRDFLTYLNGGGNNGEDLSLGGGDVEELEARFPAVSTTSLRSAWLSWATAGYVVYNKLRSPLGKAQETLGHIDQACRRLAALTAGGAATIPLDQGRRLVHFVTHLEKAMQNAWDGCSTAGSLPPAHKSAALFFYANKKTCQDWLERIRGNVMRVAYSVGSYGEVVRHAWSLLPALVKREELDSPTNLYLGESDSIVCVKVNRTVPYCILGRLFTAGPGFSLPRYRSLGKILVSEVKKTHDFIRKTQNVNSHMVRLLRYLRLDPKSWIRIELHTNLYPKARI